MSKLSIKNLHVAVKGKEILHGVDLDVSEGETLALLGPNGHGKSTLLAAIMGNPAYQVTAGTIMLDDQNVLALSPDKRSRAGLFLAMQYPSEIPGLNSADFLKAAMNAHADKPLSLFQFYNSLQKAYEAMGIPFEMSKRNLNEGFSGGEKKRNEMLQMKLLQPKIALLDEIDSGLDVDAMGIVAKAIGDEEARGAGFLVVSHYARLYNMIKPTRAAILINGRIAVSGGIDLIEKVDTQGYEWIKTELGIPVEKENDNAMNSVSIGACATRVAVNNDGK
ncbi:MAG: Fe-S cluster assembly ATPase SufC [Bacilli bacterium]